MNCGCVLRMTAFCAVLLLPQSNGVVLFAQPDKSTPKLPLVLSPSQVTIQDNLHSDMVASFEESLYQEKLNSNRSVPAILNLLAMDKLNYDEIFGAIGLTDAQRADIVAMQADYSKKLTQIEQQPYTYELGYGSLEDQIKGLKDKAVDEFRERFNEVMLPHQLEAILSMDALRVGFAKTVTESPVGDILKVTDRQKEKIRKRADALADKIEKFNREIREESLDIVAEELDAEQMEQLMKTYPREEVLRLYSTAQLYTLFSFNKYTFPDSFDRRTSAAALIYGVEIKEKKDRK
jgi:hypothetical protein